MAATDGAPASATSATAVTPVTTSAAPSAPKRKLSYKEQRELETLPALIESLETEQASVLATMSQPDFYQQDKEKVSTVQARMTEIENALAKAYERWELLDN